MLILKIVSSIAISSGIVYCANRLLQYEKTYIILLLITAATPISALIVDKAQFLDAVSLQVRTFLVLILFAFVPILFVLSIRNLFRKNKIHWLISMVGIVVSSLLPMVFMVIFKIAGSGMIG